MKLDFDKQEGLVPAVVQDSSSGEILMVAYMNKEAWEETVKTGFATFWSRSREKLWRKGENSGNRLLVKQSMTDCDSDTVVLKVEVQGPGVCHEGYLSCFYKTLKDGEWEVNAERVFDPAEVYV